VHPEQYCLFELGRIDFAKIRARKELTMTCQRAPNTIRAYASAWKTFRAWCEDGGRASLPATAETVCYFADWTLNDEGLRLETVHVRLKAIAHYHRQASFLSPTRHEDVRAYLECAARERTEEPGGKQPITPEQLRKIAMLECHSPAQIRNRAMLLLAFASGWRRSEIVALDRRDVEFPPGKGIGLRQWKSKTDQKGEGRYVGIHFGDHEATCPVRALRAWLALRGDWQGPLFTRLAPDCKTVTRDRIDKRGEVLYAAIKRWMERIGEDPALYGGHSTRSGFVTAASERGASIAAIKQRTGHKCTRTLERYIRIPTAFGSNPMKGVL
jgi:integrase